MYIQQKTEVIDANTTATTGKSIQMTDHKAKNLISLQ
jgi:hypothetical protein